MVETFKEFRSMLLIAVLHVHTDHRNLIYNTLHTQRVLQWRLYFEEYHPTFHYVKGPDNAIADSISRLPRLESLVGDDIDIGPKSPTSTSTSTFSIELDDEPLLTCFLNLPIFADNIQYPLDYNSIHDRQLLDIQLILNQTAHLILNQQTKHIR